MPEYAFETVDVFTDQRFGGNPLAVLPDAGGLDDARMLSIAREFNLSETTFVFPPADPANDARVRIFTPVFELPFAGHPNVGTALVLARRRARPPDLLRFEEAAGLVSIALDWSGTPTATVRAPQPLSIGERVPAAMVASCAGLPVEAIRVEAHPPCVASVGTEFVIAEVEADALARAAPNLLAMREAAALHPVRPGGFPLHLYVREHAPDCIQLRTRMFSPLSGITEDPATGSANAALVALLLSLGEAPTQRYRITQGDEMGRPSRLSGTAERRDGGIWASIGGSAVPVLCGTLSL